MSDGGKVDLAPTRGHLFNWLAVWSFLGLYVVLILTIALAPEFLAVISLGGLTRGHLLVLLLHIPPVIAAWIYIYAGQEPGE